MDSQLYAYFPIPILLYIIEISSKDEKLTFRQTCKLFREFVDREIFPVFSSPMREGIDDIIRDYEASQAMCCVFMCLDSACAKLYFTDANNTAIEMLDLESKCSKSIWRADKLERVYGISLDEAKNALYFCLGSSVKRLSLSGGSVETLCDLKRGYMRNFGSAHPLGLAFDSISRHLYVADCSNNAIIRICVEEQVKVELLCGSGFGEYIDGSLEEARLRSPCYPTLDPISRILYVIDGENYVVRSINLGQETVSTLCGTPIIPGSNMCKFRDGLGKEAVFGIPLGLSLDTRNGYLYVADVWNYVVRRVSLLDADHTVSTVYGQPGVMKSEYGIKPLFKMPTGLVLDPLRECLYVADGPRIHKIINRKNGLA